MISRKVVRITKTEFETADGKIRKMPFDLDYLPTLEGFQFIYDQMFDLFCEKGLICERLEVSLTKRRYKCSFIFDLLDALRLMIDN